MENIDNDNDRIKLIMKKLDSIDEKIDALVDDMNKNIKPVSNKMSCHIDFIEKVYDVVKSPLGFICERANFLSKNKKSTLDEKSVNPYRIE